MVGESYVHVSPVEGTSGQSGCISITKANWKKWNFIIKFVNLYFYV